MTREERIVKLKEKIKKYLDNGGSIYDSKKDIPYYRYMTYIICEDYRNGEDSNMTSVYKECGYEYKLKTQPATLERVKKEIDEYVKNGGDIYAKKETLPYYGTIHTFIKGHMNEGWNLFKIYECCGYKYEPKNEEVTIDRLKKEIDKYVANGGDIYCKNPLPPYYDLLGCVIKKFKKHGKVYGVEDIMKLCGYDWHRSKLNTFNLLKVLEQYKDEYGYIDSINNSEEGKQILFRIKRKAVNKGMELNDYLMVVYGVRLYETNVDVDYFSLVEKELKQFEQKYGRENVTLANLGKYNKRLLYRINHLATYFPYGSVNSSVVLDALGYNVRVFDKREIDEKKVIEKLLEIYPDREVYKLNDYPSLRYSVVSLSAINDQTIEQYLNTRGFSVKKKGVTYRLSKALVVNDNELYEKIKVIREDLIKNSRVLNDSSSSNKEINDELNEIAKKTMEVLNKNKKITKR